MDESRSFRKERSILMTFGAQTIILTLLFAIPFDSESQAISLSNDSGWSAPSQVQAGMANGRGGPFFLDTSVNGAGDAIAVWLQGSQACNPLMFDVFAALYQSGKGWTAPVVLDTTAIGSGGPDVAMDDSGSATVVWEHNYGDQYPAQPSVINAKRYTRDLGWGSSSTISLGSDGACVPQVGMDAVGNAIAVWAQYGTSARIWSNGYLVGVGWGAAQRIDNNTSPFIGPPAIALGPAGNAAAVWSQDADEQSRIWTNRYSSGMWGSPVEIGEGWYPKVVADSAGGELVVWEDSSLGGGYSSICSSRFTPGIGWKSTILESFTDWSTRVSGPNVAMNPDGDAITTWVRCSGTYMRVVASRYASGSGWCAPVTVGSPVESRSPGIDAAINPLGDAIVIWDKIDPSPPFIMAARFNGTSGWDVERPLDLSTGSAGNARIGVDSKGNFLIAWEQSLRSGTGLWWDTYSVDEGWGVASLFLYVPACLSGPQLCAYGEGNAITVWSHGEGNRSSIWVNTYREGTGWQYGTSIASSSDFVVNPDIGADPNGNAIAVWEQWDGSRYSVWSSSYRIGVGWGLPSAIDNGSETAYDPRVTVDRFGNAFAFWYQRNESVISFWVNRYDVISGWGTPAEMGLCEGDTANPKIEVDDQGNAIAVWTSGPHVWSKRYVQGTGWSRPDEIGPQLGDLGPDTRGIFCTHCIDVDLSPQGDAIVVWPLAWWNESGGTSGIWANWFQPGVGWARPCEVYHGETSGPQVVMSDHDSNLILWQPYLGYGDRGHIVTTHRPPGGAWGIWGTPEMVDDVVNNTDFPRYPIYRIDNPLIAMDASGNAIAVWQEDHGDDIRLLANAYTAGVGWGIPAEVSGAQRAVLDHGTRIAMDASGNVIVIWLESDDNGASIWSVRYGLRDLPPDTSIIVPNVALLRWVVAANTTGIIILASLVIILYRTSRRSARREAIDSRSDLPSAGSDASSMQVMATNAYMSGSNVLINGFNQERRWPTRAIPGPLRVTAKERILLHLLHFARYADSPEVPPELTQERIAEAAGIERRHFAQYAHPLEEDELVRERTSRVRGVVQKRRVYVLTEEGVRRALGVRDRLRSAMVRVKDDSGVREVTIAETLLEARGSLSILDVLRESIETGVVDLSPSASPSRSANTMIVSLEEVEQPRG